jgi:hypothetical protein
VELNWFLSSEIESSMEGVGFDESSMEGVGFDD